MKEHLVTFSNGQTLMVREDQNLLEACREAGIYIKSGCGGHASCSDCLIKITQGEDDLNSPSFEETQLIGNVFHITKERLSCQTKVLGPVSVDISAHDKSNDAEKLKTKKFNPPKGNVRKRTRDEVIAIKKERQDLGKEKEEKRNSWQKHWEREKDPSKAGGSGGNRRPKTFRTDFEENEAAKEESLIKTEELKTEDKKETKDS
ncbi:MAG: 2Fe-2S iron-sulfur cluster binding domain-containing protein [Bacteriovoracaceae bacterium]|nr:2Fe-2S iron-sulfur cluster binding domain-containing protein [Bacteriovoracaceae bacterium]